MSLTATHSMSALAGCPARKTLRPMRPKPLIPTRTGMLSVLPPWCGEIRPGADGHGCPAGAAKAIRRPRRAADGSTPARPVTSRGSGGMRLEHAQPDRGGRRARELEAARGEQGRKLIARALA